MAQNSKTEKLGDILVAVGSYDAGQGQTKSTNRNIGVMMQTTDANGGKRLWLKLNADILHASLFALVKTEGMDKGDDKFIANVFAPRPQGAGKPTNTPLPAGDPPAEDDVPF